MFNVQKVRDDFPVLTTKYDGKPIVYLDSTATSLKPTSVIAKVREYYEQYSANVFRGIYPISELATAEYERAREKVAAFIHAKSPSEVVFTRNTSESLNLVAYSWFWNSLRPDERIVTTIMEHHSNFVPWQQIVKEKGATFTIWNIDKKGELNINDLDKLITRKTKLLALTSLSNVLGTINPIKKIVAITKRLNPKCLVIVDAAQSVPHLITDVGDWDADFVAFSGHKMVGPTGIGVLWGKLELLEAMSPFLYGGEMIREVYVDHSVFKESPHKYEAGTPHIAGAIGLGAAVDYLANLGMEEIRQHEEMITSYAIKRLAEIPGLRCFGPKDAAIRGGIIAFTMKAVHAHDVSQVLAEENICVRAGNHCAMPLHEFLGIPASARASFYMYTSKGDIDALIAGLEKVVTLFS